MGKQESKAGATEVDEIISKLEKAGKGFDEAKVRYKYIVTSYYHAH
jgi:hypothetical protein